MSTSADSQPRFKWDISDKVVPELAEGKLDVWSVFSPLAGLVPKDSLNLGQGFMSWAPPNFVRKALSESSEQVDVNHYALPRGRISLRKALSKYLSPSFKLPEGRELDPATEIMASAGANCGMYSFATAFIRPGDEVILLEPYFDQYIAQIKFNGGIPIYIPIRAPANANKENIRASEWKVDLNELRSAITPKTKQIWINTPHNPSGKVFTAAELLDIGNIAKEHDLQIVSDEVYDCLTYGTHQHVRIASLSDFWNRTITFGSGGKTFAATGWRVGWAIGPAHLIVPTVAASTRVVFCSNGPAQEAIAIGINEALDNGFFEKQVAEYEERKNALLKGLDRVGLPYTIPDGSYFVMVNIENLEIPEDFKPLDAIKNRSRDWKAAWFVAQTAGVVSIPPTDFYNEGHWDLGEKFLRLAFCKDVPMIEAACERLLKLTPYIKKQTRTEE